MSDTLPRRLEARAPSSPAVAAAFLASNDGDHMSAQIITTNRGSS